MVAGLLLAAATAVRADDDTNSPATTTAITNNQTYVAPEPTTNQTYVANESGRDDSMMTNHWAPIYRCNELSLDAFGMGSVGSYALRHPSGANFRHNTDGGAGVGINYFFTRHIGIGAEAYSQNTTGVFIDNVSANILLRLPICHSGFAPYILGGGGHQFDGAKLWFGQGGVGMEYRFCHHIGMFVDARCVWPNETKYYGVGRAGLRFAF